MAGMIEIFFILAYLFAGMGTSSLVMQSLPAVTVIMYILVMIFWPVALILYGIMEVFIVSTKIFQGL